VVDAVLLPRSVEQVPVPARQQLVLVLVLVPLPLLPHRHLPRHRAAADVLPELLDVHSALLPNDHQIREASMEGTLSEVALLAAYAFHVAARSEPEVGQAVEHHSRLVALLVVLAQEEEAQLEGVSHGSEGEVRAGMVRAVRLELVAGQAVAADQEPEQSQAVAVVEALAADSPVGRLDLLPAELHSVAPAAADESAEGVAGGSVFPGRGGCRDG
jgi:hypothetical protein